MQGTKILYKKAYFDAELKNVDDKVGKTVQIFYRMKADLSIKTIQHMI